MEASRRGLWGLVGGLWARGGRGGCGCVVSLAVGSVLLSLVPEGRAAAPRVDAAIWLSVNAAQVGT